MRNTSQDEIAATAARLIVEEGLEYGPAKRRAVRELGLNARSALPSNELIEEAVVEYVAIFCADTQPLELAALRSLALLWMLRLPEFRPHLSGAVWRGTATRLSDIYIQLFCDDAKSAELRLIDQGVRYEVSSVNGFKGERVDALSVRSRCDALNEEIGVHFMVYDYDDVRGALQPDDKGRAWRGNTEAVRRLVDSADARIST
ncbi:MAG: hypothetical protein HQ455_07335 [Burkholderiales bacterium]|nr:hypothetical protein [Burkholderiales bacterium]